MLPRLDNVTINGASRHRLTKGFLLVRSDLSPLTEAIRDSIVTRAQQKLRALPTLSSITFTVDTTEPTLVSVVLPFMPVYTSDQRTLMLKQAMVASECLASSARERACFLAASGVNPYVCDKGPIALCSDIHEVEVFDEGEVERIYNLYRQCLPELLAISTNSSVYGGVVQKDASLRMRRNEASYLPRYISQFDADHLDRLQRMMRKEYKLGNLRQMDVNPLGGTASLQHNGHTLLAMNAPAIELRFIDAQCSFPFIRAQVILFQAIAIYGRSLARRGRRLPAMHDEIIDENKAIALQDGANAMLKPDKDFVRKGKRRDNAHHNLHHDQGVPAVATTSLLLIIENMLLLSLQSLSCEVWEILPLIIGAELQLRNQPCFTNYGDYQQYLCQAQREDFSKQWQLQSQQLLSSLYFDIISLYNRSRYPELLLEIEAKWQNLLKPGVHNDNRQSSRIQHALYAPRSVVSQSAHSGSGSAKMDTAYTGMTRVSDQKKTPNPRYKGTVIESDRTREKGILCDDRGQRFPFLFQCVEGGEKIYTHDKTFFDREILNGKEQVTRIQIYGRAHNEGRIKAFDAINGIIVQNNGAELYFNARDLLPGTAMPAVGQLVRYQIIEGPAGSHPVSIHVSVEG